MSLADVDLARVLHWEGCYNVRDLGGLRTADGHTIRWRALVRSDILSRLTETGRAALVDHGIRSIVDVRFADEVAADWDTYPFRGSPSESGVHYYNAPFNAGQDEATRHSLRTAYRAAATRSELNRLDLDGNAAGIVAALAAIADAPAGGVLIHCHGGKDRTGMVTALLLSLVGVEDDVIADDYAMTSLNLEPLIIGWLDSMSDDPGERERLRALATPAREAMLDTLSHLREGYGSAAAYLRAAGLYDTHLDRLRSRLLEVASR